jgi:glycosyltransferase involved in cell wall biosynthesis
MTRADAARGERPRAPVLFVSYNGLLDPIGQSQVLPYVRGLVGRGWRVAIVSFEKPDAPAAARHALAGELSRLGVRWRPLRYHASGLPVVQLYDLCAGLLVVTWLTLVWRARMLHARSTVAATMTLPAVVALRRRLLFDVRGLNAEEYVDGSGWSRTGLRYRLLRAIELYLLRRADAVVVLTERVRSLLAQGGYGPPLARRSLRVIPCCVDLDHFRHDPVAAARVRGEVGGDPLFVYLGSLGTWYLADEMLAFFRAALRGWPAARLLVLTPSSPSIVAAARERLGIPAERVVVRRAGHGDVPAYLSAADVGLCFIQTSLAKQASSPTKLAEYLACGVPVVANAGVGDVEDVVDGDGVGVVVKELGEAAYADAVARIARLLEDPGKTREACRRSAERRLALAAGINQYDEVYRLVNGRS